VDEEPRTGGSQVSAGERSPDEIRADIGATREELGETVEALAEKTDVKEQARQSAGRVADHAKERPVPYAAAGALAAGIVIGILIRRS
jgi:ElaB/YqjD/DUF883 family membrane-anchored ribosome-binding protein